MSTAKYDRDGIVFQYPENWQLDEDPPQGVPRTISVTSDAGAFWSVTVYDRTQHVDELKREYLQTLQQEYEDAELDAVQLTLGSLKLDAVDLQFYCLDFLVHSRLLVLEHELHCLLVAWQAEDRDFDKLEPVFSAITFSILQSGAMSSGGRP